MARPRRTADFFEWKDRGIKERGVIKECLEHSDVLEGVITVAPGPDAPDAIGITSDHSRIAIEVTEVVDESVLRINAAAMKPGGDGRVVYREWDEGAFVSLVTERLKAKDAVELKEGPYASCVVVMHCDELGLRAQDARVWLERHDFGRFAQVDRACLVFSYDPDWGCCPCIPLRVGKRSSI